MSSYLQIGLQSQDFGLPLEAVEEILLLPEIAPLPDAPGDVVGIIDRRGQTLPVIHLAKRLHIAEPKCRVTDNLVVVNPEGFSVGLIVERVSEIFEVATDRIDLLPNIFSPPLTSFLSGVIRLGEKILPLIDPSSLIRSPVAVQAVSTLEVRDNLGDFYSQFAPQATPQEQAIFYQRRINLSQQKQQETQEKFSIALAEINNEVIGIPLEQVREFVIVDRPAPMPFSPAFILGAVNLRSEILPLIDILNLLGLKTIDKPRNEAIVTQVNNLNLGIAVDEIRGIVDIDQSLINLEKETRQGVTGTAIFEDEIITIVDLPELLYKLK